MWSAPGGRGAWRGRCRCWPSATRARTEAGRAERAAGEARDRSVQAEQVERTAAGARGRADAAAAEVPALEARAEQLREAEGWSKTLRRHGGAPDLPGDGALPWDEDAYQAARDQLAREQALAVEERACAAEERELGALRLRAALGAENLAAWRIQKEQITVQGKAMRAERDAAQEELRAARERAGAAALRPHLHLGGACPLCEQMVRALPQGDAPPTWARWSGGRARWKTPWARCKSAFRRCAATSRPPRPPTRATARMWRGARRRWERG